VGDKIISNANLTTVGNHIVFYIPTTQQYFIAKNFYNSAIKKDDAVNVELLQENNPYLHIWGNDSGNFYCLYKGSDHSLKSLVTKITVSITAILITPNYWKINKKSQPHRQVHLPMSKLLKQVCLCM